MGKSQFRYLSQEDILSLNIPYEQVIDTVEKAMGEFAKGTCQLPVKVHVNTRPVTYINAMPAYVGGEHDITGLKWVAGYPENRKKGLPVSGDRHHCTAFGRISGFTPSGCFSQSQQSALYR